MSTVEGCSSDVLFRHSKTEQCNRSWLEQVTLIIRRDFRNLFGLECFNQCGFFVNRWMSAIVQEYSHWPEYPNGDQSLRSEDGDVRAAVVSDDGFELYIGTKQLTITVWNLINHSRIRRWKIEESAVKCLAFHSGLLFSGHFNGKIRIWDTTTQVSLSDKEGAHSDDDDHYHHLRHTLDGNDGGIESLSLNAKGTEIVSCFLDICIRVWSVDNGECLRVILGHHSVISSVIFIDDCTIVSGSYDQCVRIWDTSNGKQLRMINENILDCVNWLCLNCDASLLAVFVEDGLMLLNVPDLQMVNQIGLDTCLGCFHPSNPDLLALDGFEEFSVMIYNVRTGDHIRTFRKHTDYIDDICFTPDGLRLISIAQDTTQIWDISDL